MSMGKRKRDRQPAMWGDSDELADGRESSLLSSVESAAARARLRRLGRSAMCRLLRRHDGPPQLAPGIYFRLLLIGYFEGIDSERGIARCRFVCAARLSRPGAAGGAARSLARSCIKYC